MFAHKGTVTLRSGSPGPLTRQTASTRGRLRAAFRGQLACECKRNRPPGIPVAVARLVAVAVAVARARGRSEMCRPVAVAVAHAGGLKRIARLRLRLRSPAG